MFFRSSNIIYRSISHFLLTFLIFILMNIFVAKLNYDTDEDTLRGSFEEYGAVDSAKVVMDKFTGRSKGFGFVEMPDDSEAMAAINGLNDTEIDGAIRRSACLERQRNSYCRTKIQSPSVFGGGRLVGGIILVRNGCFGR